MALSEWVVLCMYTASRVSHDHSFGSPGQGKNAMGLFRRAADSADQPEVRCQQCGERLPDDGATVCTMCGAARQPVSHERTDAAANVRAGVDAGDD
jgi:hypothetical protein